MDTINKLIEFLEVERVNARQWLARADNEKPEEYVGETGSQIYWRARMTTLAHVLDEIQAITKRTERLSSPFGKRPSVP